MINSLLRLQSRRLYKRLMVSGANKLDENDLKRSAIVLAPHQDDETLGCGGTIIKKKSVGADVKIVFMTDGSGSHSHLISSHELTTIRAEEAIAAAEKLGLREDDVISLAFKDGQLSRSQTAATQRVAAILHQYYPDEIFIPYRKDGPPDHVTTWRIAQTALRMSGCPAMVYEYPIWFWFQWPWTSFSCRRSEIKFMLKNGWYSGLGWRFLQDFRCSVYIGDVLEQKRIALDQHRSQMSRLRPDLGWPTLADSSNGEFLACFLQDFEFFRRYQY